MASVTVTCSDKKWALMGKEAEKIARFTFLRLKNRSACADFFLVTNKEMQSLNVRYHGKKGATNVLSFPAHRFPRPDMARGRVYRGEVYLAPDYVLKKKENFILLVIHATLHLLGYTHENKNDRMRMERTEDDLLADYFRVSNRITHHDHRS